MTISLLTRALACSLFATVASAQTVLVPVAPPAAVTETAASAGAGSMSILVAIARVGAGLRPDRETTCIQQTRSAGDMATLRFFLSHDDRADTGSPPFPGDRNAAAAQGGPAAE